MRLTTPQDRLNDLKKELGDFHERIADSLANDERSELRALKIAFVKQMSGLVVGASVIFGLLLLILDRIT